MMALDVAKLNQNLLGIVGSYQPIYGEAFPISDEMKSAFLATPRHKFVGRFKLVGEHRRRLARTLDDPDALAQIYANQPLMYIGGQGEPFEASSSEPAFIMQLLAALDVGKGSRVLEIGCGTGWLLAMMARLCAEPRNVTGIEIVPELVARAKANLSRVGLSGVQVVLGDGNAISAELGGRDRVIYTASTYAFPEYLFDVCERGGKVVIPLRNRGTTEEVQILQRTETGFISITARVCKFVQMTRRSGEDLSGIKTPGPSLKTAFEKADSEPVEIPGDRTGFFMFSSFLSKTCPEFGAIHLGDDNDYAKSSGPLGDPLQTGLALLAKDKTSGAVWNRGVLRSFGDSRYRDQFVASLTQWISLGRPIGADFKLTISKETPAKNEAEGRWSETRGGITFTWTLDRI